MKFRVALAQVEPIPAAPLKNVDKLKNIVNNYEADLYIFPELFLTGYTSKDLIPRYSLTLAHPIMDSIKMLAKEKRIGMIIGFPEKSDWGFLYNSALAINERGEIFVYRKRHLPTFSVFDEHRWFRPYRGRIIPWIFRSIGIGIGICYDIFFPEIFRAYTLMGSKLLVVISASPDSSVPLFHILAKARALENTTYFLWVNMVGFFDGLGFGGSSLVVDPLGNVIAELKSYEEEIKVVELDLGIIDKYRSMRPVIRDTYIEDAEILLASYREFEGLR